MPPGAYADWNSAIAEVVFGDHMAHRPVYLDLEDDVLEAVGARMGREVPVEELARELGVAVRDTLGEGNALLAQHAAWLATWRSSDATTEPPVLAVLAVFTVAADRMAQGENVSAQNYYVRLCEVLGLDPEAAGNVGSGYRQHALELWRGLDDWLRLARGERGLSTIRISDEGGNRHIAPALGQAIVRSVERTKLGRFFVWAGLRPEQEVDQNALESMLGRWIGTPSCPLGNQIKGRWDKPEVREALAQAAQSELWSWDGLADNDTEGGSVILIAIPRKNGPLELGPCAVGWRQEPPSTVGVGAHQYEASWQDIGDGVWLDTLRPEFDFLGQEVRLGGAVRPSGPVTVFRRDGGRFLEARRLELDVPHIVIANGSNDLLRKAIEAVLRPGFKPEPEGPWTVYYRAVVGRALAPSELPAALDPLAPAIDRPVALVGGLKLPGNRGAWHAGAPPALQSFDHTVGDVRATIQKFSGQATDLPVPNDSVVDLQPFVSGCGAYRLEVEVDGRSFTLSFQLTDSDEPSLKWLAEDPDGWLARVWEAGRAAWAAATSSNPAVPVPQHGVVREERLNRSDEAKPPDEPQWHFARPAASVDKSTGQMLLPDYPDEELERYRNMGPGGCRVTGGPYVRNCDGPKHTWRFCKFCGDDIDLQKELRERFERRVDLQPPPSVAGAGNPIAGVVLDGVRHLRGGSVGRLRDWASNAGWEVFASASLVRDLVALGHVELGPPGSGGDRRWSMTGPSLLGHATDPTAWLVGGLWTASERRALEEAVADLGGRVAEREIALDSQRVPTTVLEGIGFDGVELVADEVGDQVAVVPDAGRALLHVLGGLDVRRAGLPERTLTRDTLGRRFDARSARFAEDRLPIEAPGAYRVGSGYRDEHWWVDGGRAWLLPDGDHAKVLAARAAGVPLMAYSSGVVRVPLGARLPGVYERAIVLSTHSLPVVPDGLPEVHYRGVPEDVAMLLYQKLYCEDQT